MIAISCVVMVNSAPVKTGLSIAWVGSGLVSYPLPVKRSTNALLRVTIANTMGTSTITASTIRRLRFRFGGVAAAAGDPGLAERLSVASAKSVVGTGPVAGAATLGWAVGSMATPAPTSPRAVSTRPARPLAPNRWGPGVRTGRGGRVGPVGPVAQ